MGEAGLEPASLTAHAREACVFSNFTPRPYKSCLPTGVYTLQNPDLLAKLLLFFRNSQDRLDDRIRIERHALYPLFHQKLGEIREVRRSLPANADVFAALNAPLHHLRDKFLHRLVFLVGDATDDPRITIKSHSQLRQII